MNGCLWGLCRVCMKTPAWYWYILVKQKNICSCDCSYFLTVPYAKNREQSMWPYCFLFAHNAQSHAPHSFKMHLKSQTSTVAVIRRSVWGAPGKMSWLLAKMLFKEMQLKPIKMLFKQQIMQKDKYGFLSLFSKQVQKSTSVRTVWTQWAHVLFVHHWNLPELFNELNNSVHLVRLNPDSGACYDVLCLHVSSL